MEREGEKAKGEVKVIRVIQDSGSEFVCLIAVVTGSKDDIPVAMDEPYLAMMVPKDSDIDRLDICLPGRRVFFHKTERAAYLDLMLSPQKYLEKDG